MARITTMKLGEDYTLKLLRAERLSAEIARKAIEAGANVVANKIRANLNANLAGSTQNLLESHLYRRIKTVCGTPRSALAAMTKRAFPISLKPVSWRAGPAR